MLRDANEAACVKLDQAGEFVLPADLLAERFGWPSNVLRDYMRRGLIVSRIERGQGEDLGRWRLSVRCGNRRWQAIIDGDGKISAERFETLGHRGRT